MPALSIPLRSNPGTYRLFGAPRLVNAYAEAAGDDNKAPFALIPCVALTALGSDVDGVCRGMIWLDDDQKLYAAFGYYLYEVNSAGAKTQIGSIGGTTPVSIARNDANVTQVMIVSDGKVFELAGGVLTLKTYTDAAGNSVFANSAGTVIAPSGVTQCGGYFVVWLPDGRFFSTGLNTTAIDALDYATAEADPDGLVAAFGSGNTLYLFGTRTVEVWNVSGSGAFPFQRVLGAHLRFGTRSPHTVREIDRAVALVCADNVVRIVSGYDSRDISTNEVSRLIEAEADPSALYAFVHSRGANKFYCLQGTGWTREYNAATGAWHDRQSGNDGGQWKAAHYARAFNLDVFGSRETGRTFKGEYETYVEDGAAMLWGFDTQVFHSHPNGLSFDRIDMDMETGHGPATSVESEVLLSWSDDNGRTWKGYRHGGLGVLGGYRRRVRFNGLGQCDAKGRMFRVRVSDPVIRAITSIDAIAHPVAL